MSSPQSLSKPTYRTPGSIKITVMALVACALSLWIQWLSGDPAFGKFPMGPFFFIVIAGIVAVGGRWRWTQWTPLLGTAVSSLVAAGWFARWNAEIQRIEHPGTIGNFALGICFGTLLQIVSLLIAGLGGVIATIAYYRRS